jgi:hypothetical protein
MDEWVVSGFSDRFKRRELVLLNPHAHLTTARNHLPPLQQEISSRISPALLRAV